MTIITKFFSAIFIGFLFHFANAQDITGEWKGVLKVTGSEFPIEITIIKDNQRYTSTLKSPNQSNQSIPADVTSVRDQEITIEIKTIMVTYKGTFEANEIKGTFTQAGNSFALNLTKNLHKEKPTKRPQDPIKPYPYISEEIIFENEKVNKIKLSGTLTLPKNIKNPPVVILISGSGPQNRNEEVFGHKPFLVLSDFLTRQGIAVLRYDERGVGASEGSFRGATSSDFASDVAAAISFLKKRNDIDAKKIGLIGHSEGGFIAPMVASINKDVAFIVSLAGTGVDGKQVLLSQMHKSATLGGASPEVLKINNEFSEIVLSIVEKEAPKVMWTKTKTTFDKHRNTLSKEMQGIYTNEILEKNYKVFTKDPWLHYFIKTDPFQFISKIKIPILAINGSKDTQVIAKLNLEGFKKGLEKAKNKDFTIKELEGLNHLFQTAHTGSGNEYAIIEETFNPKAMKIVSDWILERF